MYPSFARQFVLIIVFCSGLSVLGQDVAGPKYSIDHQDISLGEMLDILKAKYGLEFSYSSQQIPLNQQINVLVEDKPLDEFLDELLFGLTIDYRIIENKIVLTPKSRSQLAKYTISGLISDKLTGEALIGATCLIPELNSGTISNNYGFYSITLPEGYYQVSYNYVGYQLLQKQIRLDQNLKLNIELPVKSTELSEVVVNPSDSLINAEAIHHNSVTLDRQTITTKTASFGESDLIKSIDIIPGIQLFRDGSSFYNVRGGDRDQNQILLDEAPIYNPAHFLGLFSSLIPESIKDLKIYRGDMPARFGGRISSVMDIQTRDGNLYDFGAEGSVGLIAGRLAIEGPIKKGKSSFFVSGRRSYIGEFLEGAGAEINSLYFSDFNAKLNLKLNNKNRLYLSGYVGRDELLADGGVTWGNFASTLRWNHIFGDRLFSNTTVYTSRYEYELISNDGLNWSNHIANASIKSDFSFYASPKNTLAFGFRLSGHNIDPGNLNDENGDIPAGFDFVPKKNATEFSLYLSNDQKITKNLLLNYGLRLSNWTNYGRTIEYEFDENYEVVDSTIYDERTAYNEYSNLEPRLSLTWLLGDLNFLKVNYTRSAQYLSLISNSISPFNNLEVWLPASVNIKPQLADQYSIGWVRESTKWRFSLESYFKKMHNQVDYVNQAWILLNPHMEGQLRSGNGYAYGFEAMIEKTFGAVNGSITYAHSRSLRKIEAINDGNLYPTSWDRPHQFVVNTNVRAAKRTLLSGAFYLSSGAPITTPTSFYNFSGRVVPIYEEKNNDRLLTYRRFDIAAQFQLNQPDKTFSHFITVSLFNFLSLKNNVLQNFNKIENDQNEFIVPTNVAGNQQVQPTNFYVYRLIPSIAYSFRL